MNNDAKIEVVFDHEDWILCYKPINVNFHSQDSEAGFVVLVKQQLNIELWPVHRLDKATSGLILLAKTKQACANLSKLFAERQIEKFYLAICENGLKKKQGKVAGDMAKTRNGSYKLLKTNENPAITQFLSKGLVPGFRLCLLKPKTGKTHQLRVMMKSLAASIVGDKRYGGKTSDRLYLHAFAIKFEFNGQVFEFSAPPKEGELFLSPEFKVNSQDWLAPWLLKWP
ncbi:MAG: tRNA pseudouridine32 synthase/23S rRNA pseudouridine746 synthase [Bermanella sp.]